MFETTSTDSTIAAVFLWAADEVKYETNRKDFPFIRPPGTNGRASSPLATRVGAVYAGFITFEKIIYNLIILQTMGIN